MYLRRSAVVKYCIAALVGAVIYCEWFIYLLQPVYWQNLQCQEDISCTKILFIADPQIQGELAVPPPLSYIFNWDSDRYLKSTFSVVLKHFRPDVLVYLGDLMDEGSIATIPQFHGYVKRLSKIFDIDYPVVQVWLPGDNDIGGENEPIKKDKVVEFNKVFDQPSIIVFSNISFYKVDGITHSIPQMDAKDNQSVRIVVSHYPLTSKYVASKLVNNEIHPHIYFCAHLHQSKYVKQSKELDHRQTYSINPGDSILDVDLNGDLIYEIFVPTCSYRMGTSTIGYGAAVLENYQHMRYTVFWSSTRFPYLFFYLTVLAVSCLYFTVYCVSKLLFRRTKYIRSSDHVPLLNIIS